MTGPGLQDFRGARGGLYRALRELKDARARAEAAEARAAALRAAIEAEIGAWPDGNERASDYAAARGQCKRAIQAVLADAAGWGEA